MISHEQSSIQQNRAESARLAALMEEFLSRGGQIVEAPSAVPAPRPYGYSAAVISRKAPAPRRSKKATMQSIRIAPDIEEALARKRRSEPSVLGQVRELAKTMSQGEVCETTGISRSRLYKMAVEHGFEFQPAPKRLPGSRLDLEEDAKNVERIKALRDIGVNQRKAAEHMGISRTMFRRLVRDYAIDYPGTKRRNGY